MLLWACESSLWWDIKVLERTDEIRLHSEPHRPSPLDIKADSGLGGILLDVFTYIQTAARKQKNCLQKCLKKWQKTIQHTLWQ